MEGKIIQIKPIPRRGAEKGEDNQLS